jgi:sarcosine oxidase subunit alpha
MKRLPPIAGEWIDRSHPVRFSFEGQNVSGYVGDTISSALAAAGVRILGRSFKYHRPRGPLSVANHDSNAVMQVRHQGRNEPNQRGDVVLLQDGMKVEAVNTRGGVRGDRLSVLDRLSSFLPVGFYYKAFHSKRWFPRWERIFRDLTGLGKVDLTAPHRPTAKRYDFADVLVIGAGPSGLAAAEAAAARGADVLLVDENPHLGGSGCYAQAATPHEVEASRDLVKRVLSSPKVRVLTSSVASGYYADHWVAITSADYLTKVRARSVVFAQGAFEQPAVFHNNDLPGVMLASGAQRLLYRYAVAPASRIAVLTANEQGYAAALDALALGLQVTVVLDLRATPGLASAAFAERLRKSGVLVVNGAAVHAAMPGADGTLVAIEYGHLDAAGKIRKPLNRLDVDGLWMSVGFAPAASMLLQAGARMQYDDAIEQFVPVELPAGIYACGRINGVYDFSSRLADGRSTGDAAAAHCRDTTRASQRECNRERASESPNHPYPIFEHSRARNFVDFDEDVQVKDLLDAAQEGFDSPELLKRFTTVGMGPSQGKHSNLNALRVLARATGRPMSHLTPTTSRPMFHPVPLSHLAGRGFTPERRTPIDAIHERLGAVWMPAGNWRRPELYARPGLTRERAIHEEAQAVRTAVGLIDVGTLGKIQAYGAHAGDFLDRIYTGRFSNLKIGMTRYGLMTDDTGTVVDDGVVGRLAEQVFYFTTSTTNSASVLRELGRLATWWAMPVGLVNLTGHFAAFNLAGPLSRRVLAKLTSLDLSPNAFPYLGLRQAVVAGSPATIMRVGFVGELGYEIHFPATQAQHVWNALLDAGREYGLRPFGVEAQRLLRLEKGHIIVGQDTDGLTTPYDIGAAWALKMDKPHFIGQRSLQALTRLPPKQRLVGFRLGEAESARPKECHLVIDRGNLAGRITSVAYSPALQRVIGLAMVTPSLATTSHITLRIDHGKELRAEIVPLPFYDGEGARQKIDTGLAVPA